MPELYSRMDSVNWLTPVVADILDQGANPPSSSGSIREHMLTIQRELEDLDTPARIVNVRSSPSYHLFVARPEMIGKTGNRRPVAPAEIDKSLERIAENHPDWSLGFMPTLKGEENAVGILLRTNDHRPQSLRRLLVRDVYRKHATTTGFTCGITLEQQVIIRDLAELGHLLVIGKDTARQHVVQGILLTLTLLNTPGELRLALAGESARSHKMLASLPHALGRLLPDAVSGQRLLAGLVKEVQRRQQGFQEENVRNLNDYNARQRDKKKAELPRILMLIDSLSDASWLNDISDWLPTVMKLVSEGNKVGIHLLLTADEFLAPEALRTLQTAVTTRIVLRQAAKEITKDAPLHRTQLKFIDAFVVEGKMETRKDTRITPIEICAITGVEIKRTVDYWRNAAKQRINEAATSNMVSGRTGVTGILQTHEAAQVLVKPPVPERPQQQTLQRAAQVLASETEGVTSVSRGSMRRADTAASLDSKLPPMGIGMDDTTVTTPMTVPASFITDEIPVPIPDESAESLDFLALMSGGTSTLQAPDDTPPTEKAVAIPDYLKSYDIAESNGIHTDADEIPFSVAVSDSQADQLEHARALAAYLGWLSVGALQDIFGMSRDEAQRTMLALQAHGILESSPTTTPRFLSMAPKQE